MKLRVVFESEKIRAAYMNGEKKFAWEYGNTCIDMRCAEESVVLAPFETRLIDSGIRLQLENDNDNVGWRITSSSGMAARGILCHSGTIDYTYTGVAKICLTNLSNAPISIEFGDRIAQLFVELIVKPEIVFVEKLEERKERGENAFGSSGVK
ncbi:deoxyuridine 5'-triphosphate nucleotidohydrolase [Bacteroidia bacterium]|nr:deoxyuridine 5'-triphosphate nucleotidohydrolase [Bacteroidia bacterium]